MAEVTNFPADELVAGRLRLSGSDALGPNPWTAPRPTLEKFNLTRANLDDHLVMAQQAKAEREVKQLPYRVFSAFLLPLTAVAGAWWAVVGNFNIATLPPFEWAVYLGASLMLGAVAARMQTRQHAEAKDTLEDFISIADRRSAFRAEERAWLDDQRRRTTTAFWLDEIPKIAAERELPASTIFAQEISKLFVAWTWNVKLNQRAHDYGVDIFARGNEGSAVILCEHGRDASPDPAKIRDLAGSRHAFNADYGLLISIRPPGATPQNEFFSDKGQLEFWHLGHLLEQCIVLFKQRTGEAAPDDGGRSAFLNEDGTPVMAHSGELQAAE